MTTRLILTICLMMTMLMPCAWAGEKDASASPLSQVTITAEDWVEEDTYHIRYTFTNPTDELIDEEIKLTEIMYHCYYNTRDDNTIVQCSETISRLTIAPHSSYTTTVSLKQPIPSAFNRIIHSNFYFKDSSYLNYSDPFTYPKSHFSLAPSVSPSGDVSFTIQNNSLSETITDLRNIRMGIKLQDKIFYIHLTEPYPLTIKPNEATTLPLFVLDNTIYKDYSHPLYDITMDINGIPHIYDTIIGSDKTAVMLFKSQYIHPEKPTISEDSVFYLDESNLYAYLQVQNRRKKPISAPNIRCGFMLPYFDKNTYLQYRLVYFYLPSDFYLDCNETKYFTITIPLPKDFHKLDPHSPLCIFVRHLDLSAMPLFPLSQLSLPVPKEQYIPLTVEKITKPGSRDSTP